MDLTALKEIFLRVKSMEKAGNFYRNALGSLIDKRVVGGLVRARQPTQRCRVTGRLYSMATLKGAEQEPIVTMVI